MGFGITVAPLAIVAAAHLTFMPQIVAAMEGVDNNDQASTVSFLRMEWLATHSVVAAIFLIYWFITALFGKDQILKSKFANNTLAFCVAAYLTVTLYYIFLRWNDGLKIFCPLLGISDSDAPPFAMDPQSSCGAFAYAAHQMIFLGLLGLVVPLIISLAVRIISSRRVYQRNDDRPQPSLE